MKGEDQNWAAGTLLLLSGILGLEETVGDRLKEVGMINVMENKVLGPMIVRAERKGQMDLFQEQLTEKFGTLPIWALQRLQAASDEDFHIWAKRILSSTTLEDTLR